MTFRRIIAYSGYSFYDFWTGQVVRNFHDRQTEQLGLVRRTDKPNKKLAIFVHGFRGSYLSTWGQLAHYLERHADDQKSGLADWDFLFVGYETYSISSYLDIARLIATQWQRAATAEPPYASAYDQLALFGHSLGTLGIRQLLCAASEHPEGLLEALSTVVLIGSPINGSPLAFAGKLTSIIDAVRGKPGALAPGMYSIVEGLKPNGAQIAMLHVWNKCARLDAKAAKIRPRVIKGTDDMVVGDGGLVSWDGDRVPDMVALDHRQLSKTGKDQDADSQLLDILKAELR
jgi:pimeloyl-ACP methyl ester carboxylesterase